MKTILAPYKKVGSCILILLIIFQEAVSSQVYPTLSFNSPVISNGGSPLAVGTTYKFPNVISGVDAFVTIDSLRDGAIIRNIDSVGTGFYDAFQPIVSSNSPTSNSYARFSIVFRNTSGTLYTFPNLAATGVDIDGNSTTKEFCFLDMGGGTAEYVSSSTHLSVSQFGTAFRAVNIGGQEFTGIDTAGIDVMFTVRNDGVSSMIVKVGSVRSSGNGYRNYSVFFRNFIYSQSSPQPVLPVKLFSFNASVCDAKVDLNWKNLTDRTYVNYEVERSVDGRFYSVIGSVKDSGNGIQELVYSYPDNISALADGVIYYRLRNIDNNGAFNYSEVKLIRKMKSVKQDVSIIAFPNPVVNELRVTVPEAWQNRDLQYELYASNGRLEEKKRNPKSSQTEQFYLNGLKTGIYTVVVRNGNESIAKQIMKQ